MSSTLESYINHTVSVITADGRQIVGTLKGFDQTVNVILDDSHERVYSLTHGVEQVALGLYIVRGDNIAVIGEIDEEMDNKLDFTIIKAEPLNPVIDDLVDLYRDFAKTPIPCSAELYDGINDRNKSLRIVWKMRDMDKLETSSFAKHYSIKLSKDCNQIKHISVVGDSVDVSNDLAIASTARGSKYMAVVRKGAKDSESAKVKQWLEIWDKTTKLKSIDIDSLEEHSNIVLDSQFGNFLWSPNGKYLLYVAEYKPPKAQSFYKKKKSPEIGENDTRGQEFVYREDWGEAFDGVSHTVIAVLEVQNFKITTIEMNGLSLGQPFWIGSGDSVGFVGWDENPRRLGIVYCTNRLSSIYSYQLNDSNSVPKLVCGGTNTSLRNPRTNTDGTGFVYLESESGGAHHQSSRLMLYDWETKTNNVIIDNNSVREIITEDNNVKYGKLNVLFLDELPNNCFTSNGKYLIIHCLTELKKSLYLVNLQTKELQELNFPVDSATVIDIKDDFIITVGSSINIMPNIYIAKFNQINSIEWTEVQTNPNQSIVDVTFQSYSIPSDDPKKLITSILISPKLVESTIAPTVIIPHGGPHSVYSITYMTYRILFAKLGLKVLLVNYRGSLGVDEEYVNALSGNVGDMDVKDVIKCIKYLTDKRLIDSSKMVLFGGSHGGFLVTHLSGQYSHLDFKACIAINPVTDISGMLESTDIPDWDYFEAFGKSLPYNFDSAADPTALKVMFEKSPINWINYVKVPTLMLLGKRDRRVPLTQGLKYYRILRAKGVKAKCHIYDDKHDLGKVEVDGDLFINVCLWILNNL